MEVSYFVLNEMCSFGHKIYICGILNRYAEQFIHCQYYSGILIAS